MPVERFLDTNILLYAYDLDSPAKRETAISLLERAWLQPGSCAVSVQVLQEFQVNFVRSGNTPHEASLLIADFSRWPVVDNTLSHFLLSLELQQRWQLSLWDAMILAAAQTSGARELITEDLNHGQSYGSVLAINPFRDS
ncbi:MAG: PIN domain-containing protein [Luteolibacter sp.]